MNGMKTTQHKMKDVVEHRMNDRHHIQLYLSLSHCQHCKGIGRIKNREAPIMRNPKTGSLLLTMLAFINGALSLHSGPTQGMKQKQ